VIRVGQLNQKAFESEMDVHLQGHDERVPIAVKLIARSAGAVTPQHDPQSNYRIMACVQLPREQLPFLAKFRQGFPRRSFPALRQDGVLRFVLLGRPSAQCALPRVPCGVLHDALFVSLSVQRGVSYAPHGDRSAGIGEPPDDSLVLHDALPASFYGACVPPSR